MKADITREGILKVEALVMKKGIFKQLQEVQSVEGGDTIGWADVDGDEWILHQVDGGRLIRQRRRNFVDEVIQFFGYDEFRAISELIGMGMTAIAIEIYELWKGKTPQIFIK